MEDVNEHIDFWYRFEARSRDEAKRMRAWLVRGSHDLKELEQARVAKVVRG